MSDKKSSGQFDKFMDDIVSRENAAKDRAKSLDESEASPQRRYNKLYRERWQNTIKWGKRK